MTEAEYFKLKEVKSLLMEAQQIMYDFGFANDELNHLYIVNRKIDDVSAYIGKVTMAHLKSLK